MACSLGAITKFHCSHGAICLIDLLSFCGCHDLGADHRLVAWDATSFAEVWRIKLDAKAPATSLAYSHR